MRTPIYWLNNPRFHLMHADDSHEILKQSVENEFKHGMPRQQADEHAYAAYRRQKLLEGAAFHFRAMRAAFASNSNEAAKKHSMEYRKYMSILGFPHSDAPPKEINDIVAKSKPIASYKQHPTASMFEESAPTENPPAELSKSEENAIELERIYLMAKLLLEQR